MEETNEMEPGLNQKRRLQNTQSAKRKRNVASSSSSNQLKKPKVLPASGSPDVFGTVSQTLPCDGPDSLLRDVTTLKRKASRLQPSASERRAESLQNTQPPKNRHERDSVPRSGSEQVKKPVVCTERSIETFVPQYLHNSLDLLLQDVLNGDQNAHHFISYEDLVLRVLPQTLKQLGKMVTKWPHSGPDATIYTFQIEDVVVHPDEVRLFNAQEFGLNRTLSFRGTCVLLCRRPDEDESQNREIKREEGVLLRLPFMTSTGPSKLEAEPDRFSYSGYMVFRGKFRSVPCVQTYIHNQPILAKLKGKYMLQVRCQARNKQGMSTHTFEMYAWEVENRPKELGNLTVALPFQHRAPFNVAILALAFGCPLPKFQALIKKYAGKHFDRAVFAPYFSSMQSHLQEGFVKDARGRPRGSTGSGSGTGEASSSSTSKRGPKKPGEENAGGFQTQEDAVWYISVVQYEKDMMSTAQNMLRNQTLSHIATGDYEQDAVLKTEYLAHCTATLILHREACQRKTRGDGKLAQDLDVPTRQAFRNASFFTVAHSMMYLIRKLYSHHTNQNCKVLRRRLMQQKNGKLNPMQLPLIRIFAEPRLTLRVFSALMSGVFSATKKGATHAVTSSNRASVSAQLLQIAKPVSSSVGPAQREVQEDQKGFICFATTTDGEKTGIRTEMALSAHLTPACSAEDLFLTDHLLSEFGFEAGLLQKLGSGPNRAEGEEGTYVYGVQGYLLGVVHGPASEARAVAFFRNLRRTCVVSAYLSVSRSVLPNAIHLSVNEGVMVRPLVVASRFAEFQLLAQESCCRTAVPRAQFGLLQTAMVAGLVEYISTGEQATLCLVASHERDVDRPGVTHLEISEVSYLSRNSACNPDVTMMQGPRVAYAGGMRKQAIDSNVRDNFGVASSTHGVFCSRPLRITRVAEITGAVGMGIPLVVGVMAMKRNQEDAIVVNKRAVQFGLGQSYENKQFTSETVKSNNAWPHSHQFPTEETYNRSGGDAYRCIEANGLPCVGQTIEKDMAVICKVKKSRRQVGGGLVSDNAPPDFLSGSQGSDGARHGKAGRGGTDAATGSTAYSVKCSSTFNKNQPGMVSRARIQQIKDIGIKVMVDLIHDLALSEGDKMTSRAAQKGVVSKLLDPLDFPFSSTVTPEILVSPLGQTTRTTTSTYCEGNSSKAAAICGRRELAVDSQRLSEGYEAEFRRVENTLAQHGFNRYGTEILFDGRTGKRIPTRIWVGCIEYERPPQIASKKLHGRSTGPRDPETRQAKEGRNNHGGLRVGTMEFNAIIAHGASNFMLERWCKLSDPFTVYICKKCRCIVDLCNENIDYFFCHRCLTRDHVRRVQISFTLYVWVLEQRSGGVDMRFKVRDVEVFAGKSSRRAT